MNVVLSIEALRPPLAGIGRYVWELATRLQEDAEIESLRCISDGLWRELPQLDGQAIEITNAARQSYFSSRIRHRLGRISMLSKMYGKWMPLIASHQLSRVKNGIFHGPNFFVPQTTMPAIVTIHDLSAYLFDEWHPPTRISRMRTIIPQAIERAQLVITDSESIKKEIIDEFRLDVGKVNVIPLGVDPIYYPRSQQETLSILAQLGLKHGEYSLFISTIEPRKNLMNLLDAYAQLPQSLRQRWPLVLAGGTGWNSQHIHQKIKQAVSQGWLIYLGFVSQESLPALYSGCRLFTYPSFYEGFGLPIVEAMASGVPVLTSNCSSMLEVANGCAILVEPNDVASILSGLQVGLEDDNWREQAKIKGIAWTAKLTWDACVHKTVEAYKMAQSIARA